MTLARTGGAVTETHVIDPDEPAYEGQRHYTPAFLRIYDVLVLAVFCPAVWRCPTSVLVDQYDRFAGPRHLDVGPGTGTLLRHARLPAGVELTLLDPNPNVLAHASRRLAHLEPATVEADVLKPLEDTGPFDSIGLSNVLHCLPGPMSARAPAIDHLALVLDPRGVLFGSTVLGVREQPGRVRRAMVRSNVRKGFFDNLDDTSEALRELLAGAFEDVEIETVGTVALFRARRPTATVRPRARRRPPSSSAPGSPGTRS
jgi:SAM-dependent methyltransferase